MLRFIGNHNITGIVFQEFQYISCYGLSGNRTGNIATGTISIHLMLRFIPCGRNLEFELEVHFNTSHVTVYQTNGFTLTLQTNNFNTSHVTVYLPLSQHQHTNSDNFNTSHVTVYRALLLFIIPIS